MKSITVNTQSFTNRDNECLKSYLRDIRKCKKLTSDEQLQLVALIQEGGKAGERAMSQLMEANLLFVISVANQYSNCGVELCDLIQEGNMGLVEAAQHFDLRFNNKFLSYAVKYIQKNMLQAIYRYGRTAHINSNKMKMLSAFRKMERNSFGEDQYSVMERFCEQTDMDIHDLQLLIAADKKSKKLDARIGEGEDNDATIADMMVSDNSADADMDKESMHDDIMRTLGKALKPRELEIIKMAFGLERSSECTVTETAHNLGLCYEQTRLTRNKALDILRRSPYTAHLISYLAA